MSHTSASRRPLPGRGRSAAPRTLWEEGRRPGRQVVTLGALTAAAAAWLDVGLSGRLMLFFDVTFVVVCLAAALAVRPRDFFLVGVLPPLLMLGVVTMLAVSARGAVAEEVDGLVQAVVSGLAHHAGALAVGYVFTLGILALRQAVLGRSRRRPVR